MRSRLRDNAVALGGAGLGIGIVAWLGLSSWAWTDYDSEARPALDALAGGHFLHFLQLAPAYGGSLLMRAPFILAPKLWGGGELSMFRGAAAPCLAASAVLGIWLVARMRSLGHAPISRAVVLGLCVANPLTVTALQYGHPEELLGAVLCVAAVLVATRDRPVWAGMLLGLAVANKQWALVAVGPVLLALPGRRGRAVLAAGGTAALFTAPFALAGSALQGGASHTGHIFNPWQAWWFLGTHSRPVTDVAGHIKAGYRSPPGWIGQIAHPLIVGVTLPSTLLCLWLRRRGARRPAGEALLLLLLLLLLRFMLDPWDISYYALPFLIALVAWEASSVSRPPVLALSGSLAAWFVLEWANRHAVSPDMQSLLFMAFAVPALVAIAIALYAPGLGERLTIRAGRGVAVPSPV